MRISTWQLMTLLLSFTLLEKYVKGSGSAARGLRVVIVAGPTHPDFGAFPSWVGMRHNAELCSYVIVDCEPKEQRVTRALFQSD